MTLRRQGRPTQSNWSQERELTRTDNYQREIVRQFGKRGRSAWGAADAV